MSRPVKAEVAGETFSVRVPRRVREALVEQARRLGLSLGEMVARLVEGKG